MATESHLAEYALALHLLLQHLEGLVDIVVADENLHAVLLFDRAVNGPMAKALGHWRTDMHNSGADGTSRYEPPSIFESVPADGHHGC